MKKTLKKSLIIGLLTALIFAGYAYFVWQQQLMETQGAFIVSATLGGFVIGSLLWMLFFRKTTTSTITRGITCGGLIGLLAHPVTWYFDIIRLNICYNFFQPYCDCTTAPMNLLQGVPGSVVLSYASLFHFGWITISAGMLIGGLFAKWQSRPSH